MDFARIRSKAGNAGAVLLSAPPSAGLAVALALLQEGWGSAPTPAHILRATRSAAASLALGYQVVAVEPVPPKDAPKSRRRSLSSAVISADQMPPASRRAYRFRLEGQPRWPAALPQAGTAVIVSISPDIGGICCIAPDGQSGIGDSYVDDLSALARVTAWLYRRGRPPPGGNRAVRQQTPSQSEAEGDLRLQYEISRILAGPSTLDQAAPALMQAIGRHLGFTVGVLRELDHRDKRLHGTTVWHEPGTALATFARLIIESAPALGIGLAGTAWATGKAVWIPDCRRAPAFVEVEAAIAAGLRKAAALPVFTGGEFFGVLSFVGHEIEEERPSRMALLAAVGGQIGQFLKHRAQSTEIARLDRLYTLLARVTQFARLAQGRQELFDGICRIAVEEGGLGLAAISTYDPAIGEVSFVAGCGEGFDALVSAAPLPILRTAPERLDEVSRAVLEMRPVLNDHLAGTPELGGPRRQSIVTMGYQSSVALPLLQDDRVSGVFVVFSRERTFFTARLIELLGDVTHEIAYAQDHLSNLDRIAYLVHHDQLTQLPNRTLFQERLNQALIAARRSETRLAVIFIDVRHLREINDAYRREAGDTLLRAFAQRLAAIAERPENLARMEGARFATFVADASSAVRVARLIERAAQEVVTAPFSVSGQLVRMSAVVGIAIFPADGADVDTLLANAEVAALRAKESNRPYHFYDPSLNAQVARSLELQSALRRAADRQEFELHYQPKVDTRTRALVGLEALIRWTDPQRGAVPPGVFVPILEEIGLIGQVGEWVVRRSLAQQREWLRMGLAPLRIAVNVSVQQLQSPEFAADIGRVLQEFPDIHGSSSGGLDIEVTESVAMDDPAACARHLGDLRRLAVGIAIDDFGTGHSSLAYLTTLPAQALKIDRSFIAGLLVTSEARTIVQTIISLAHALRMQVIAEGVESEDQAAMLAEMECDQMQGYLYSRPKPAAEIEVLLRAQRR